MTRNRWMAVAAVAIVGLGVWWFALRADTLDTAKAEREIAAQIERQVGITGVTVDCPDHIEAKKGAAFQCTAHDEDGSVAPVGAIQIDGDHHVSWQLNPDTKLPKHR